MVHEPRPAMSTEEPPERKPRPWCRTGHAGAPGRAAAGDLSSDRGPVFRRNEPRPSRARCDRAGAVVAGCDPRAAIRDGYGPPTACQLTAESKPTDPYTLGT